LPAAAAPIGRCEDLVSGVKSLNIIVEIDALAADMETQALDWHADGERLFNELIGPGRGHPELGVELDNRSGIGDGQAQNEPGRTAVTLDLPELVLVIKSDQRPVGPQVLERLDVLYCIREDDLVPDVAEALLVRPVGDVLMHRLEFRE